ncbi:MAG: hypothetical protein IPM24_25765 [Bryobacterales bacterium]|nr:hypothetical protein [Bryobacterales bacterium]
MSQPFIYAEIPMFGRVYDCGECGCVHVQVGPVNITFQPDAYMQLVDLIHQSAANYETRIQGRLGVEARAEEENQ